MEKIRLALRVAMILAGIEYPIKVRDDCIFIGYNHPYEALQMVGQIPAAAGEWRLKYQPNGEYILTLQNDNECPIKIQPIIKVYTEADDINRLLYD